MNAPFTIEQFLSVFVAYNAAIWPAQIVGYVLGLLAVSALWLNGLLGQRIILTILAIMWAWNGIGYHYLFFAEINPVAQGFAALFVLQVILFTVSGVMTNGVRFNHRVDIRSALGLMFIVYALLIYPILGLWAGHGFMAGPMFGVAPCPTTIFTIAMLLLARGRWVVWLSIIPFLWSLVGLAAAIQLGIPEDLGLPVASVVLLIALTTDKLSRGGEDQTPIGKPTVRSHELARHFVIHLPEWIARNNKSILGNG